MACLGLRRRGYTWAEVIAVSIVMTLLLAVGLPALLTARERARRGHCANNLQQIGLAVHNYVQANQVFPPGTICSCTPVEPHEQYDVWGEAIQTGSGTHGTSFLLRILPFASTNASVKSWNFSAGVGGNAGAPGVAGIASSDEPTFYCPVRRQGLRPGDSAMLPATWWPGGGTDYGGCAGRHAAFLPDAGYNLCDATAFYTPSFCPEPSWMGNDPKPLKDRANDTPKRRWGIFGRVNVSTSFGQITDGASNTLMTGELQRIANGPTPSRDGWAVGGPATLFTSGAMAYWNGKTLRFSTIPKPAMLLNNRFFGSPGSDHAEGANFGIAHGSVRFLDNSVDPHVFATLGSMADRTPIAFDPPE